MVIGDDRPPHGRAVGTVEHPKILNEQHPCLTASSPSMVLVHKPGDRNPGGFYSPSRRANAMASLCEWISANAKLLTTKVTVPRHYFPTHFCPTLSLLIVAI